MTSPLEQLQRRLAERRQRATLDLPVAGLADVGVHIRYARLVGADQLAEYRRKRKGQQMLANLDLIVDSCVGIWAEVDGKAYGFSPAAATDPEEWPRFDAEARQMLPDGVGESAIDIARAIFAVGYAPDERAAADADILTHAERILEWCGYTRGGGEQGN